MLFVELGLWATQECPSCPSPTVVGAVNRKPPFRTAKKKKNRKTGSKHSRGPNSPSCSQHIIALRVQVELREQFCCPEHCLRLPGRLCWYTRSAEPKKTILLCGWLPACVFPELGQSEPQCHTSCTVQCGECPGPS